MAMLQLFTAAMLLHGVAAARVNSLAQRTIATDLEVQSKKLVTAAVPKTAKKHTFEDCHCAFTSGRKANCCRSQEVQKMGSGNQCGRRENNTCGGDTPVCCTSKVAGSHCCPAGSSCSTSCRGDGGSKKRDGGKCRCQPPPEKNVAQEYMRLPVLKMFAHLAQAAYCGPDDYSPWWQNLSTWECAEDCAGAGLRLKKGSIRRITREDMHNDNATFAYVGVFQDAGNGQQQGEHAPKDGDCVVSVAGTMFFENWMRNFQAAKRRGGKILESLMNQSDIPSAMHMGHQRIWQALTKDEDEGGVYHELKALGCGPGSGRTVFPTGQSLGAAVAIIALMDLKERGYEPGLTYVFNAPRIGNKHTMKLYRKAFGRPVSLFRMNHGKDPINRFGAYAAGFRHVGSEVYFPPNWADKTDEYVVCHKEEDMTCANRYSVVRTLAGGDDHCENPLIRTGKCVIEDPKNPTCKLPELSQQGGNICQLPDFCQDPMNPLFK